MEGDFRNTKPRSSQDLRPAYQFPDMTQRRVAERGVQCLRWDLRPYPKVKHSRG